MSRKDSRQHDEQSTLTPSHFVHTTPVIAKNVCDNASPTSVRAFEHGMAHEMGQPQTPNEASPGEAGA